MKDHWALLLELKTESWKAGFYEGIYNFSNQADNHTAENRQEINNHQLIVDKILKELKEMFEKLEGGK